MVECVENSTVNERFIDSSELTDQINNEAAMEITNNDDNNKIESYIKCRLEPINELVFSERSYVERLKLVAEKYIPLIDDETVTIPEDLTNKWRIIWGNWLQLHQWHSSFLEKLEKLVNDDPDLIPKLFLDSRAKLRTIYSKYCENHRKASVIAEQYRDFFEERRIINADKQDVVSHLMQPVQRIMRYQLPMGLIVKLTGRANLPSLQLWERALDVMKEIPKDTQLILEAARIDGFPHSITALGNIRIRGELLVALTSRSELDQCQQKWLSLSSTLSSNNNTSSQSTCNNISSSSSINNNTSINNNNNNSNNNNSSNNNNDNNNTSNSNDPLSDLKFAERRVFLFDQMLLITEEMKLKRKDPFAQSTYCYKNSINVNKMKFQPHWNFSVGNSTNNSEYHQPHELMFLISDVTPGRDKIYVMDPSTPKNREQWVVQLRDMQRMQQDFLLALQDPKRFASKVDSSDNQSSSGCGGTSTGLSSLGSSFTGVMKSAFGGSSSGGNSTHNQPATSPTSSNMKSTSKKCPSSSTTPTNKQKWPNFSGMTAVANKGGNMLKKHLRPKSSGGGGGQSSDTTSPSSGGGDGAAARISDSDDIDNKSSSADSGSTTGLESCSGHPDSQSAVAVRVSSAGAGNSRSHKSNARMNDPNKNSDVLNDDDPSTIKQQYKKVVLRRAWSAFSFRLRRSKRDPKMSTQCYSKSDELGVIGINNPIGGSGSNQITPPGSATPGPNNNTNQLSTQVSHKKKGGNIFHSMFSSGRHHKTKSHHNQPPNSSSNNNNSGFNDIPTPPPPSTSSAILIAGNQSKETSPELIPTPISASPASIHTPASINDASTPTTD